MTCAAIATGTTTPPSSATIKSPGINVTPPQAIGVDHAVVDRLLLLLEQIARLTPGR